MSDFDAYLKQLRESLDVTPARAEVILAEALSHLETKAAELQGTGLSREEAVRAAVADFGEAKPTAQALTRANGRHRGHSALRLVLAMGAMLLAAASTTGWVLAAVTRGAVLSQMGSWTSRVFVLMGRWPPDGFLLGMIVCLAPAALAAGAVGGRRHAWTAITPCLLWWGFCTVSALTGCLQPGASVAEIARGLVLWPAVAAVILWALARVGAAAASRPWTRFAVVTVCAIYSVLGLVQLPLAVAHA